jgi:hypothetical protein
LWLRRGIAMCDVSWWASANWSLIFIVYFFYIDALTRAQC